MSTSTPPGGPSRPAFDRYVVISVATTTDEHGVYVTKDSAEVIELGWILLDAKSLEEIARDHILIKPVNTPITPLCTSLTTLTWENVRNATDFKAAIHRFDSFYNEYLKAPNGHSGLKWAFITLDAWDLRVQLPREARDKSVVLPMYLQHSITFDLRSEYQRWQSYHPESLPFGSSSLGNICAALEVESVQTSAPIKHNLPFHLQALAPQAPRRAMEEAITLARVLGSLIKKSQPASEHPDVLAHPLDSSADVRAFLAERSKVLHMSGLPHDTTQSELESWYTQFGGRPIAFYTLKTPDAHKPTGTGFAVFSSHEEAAESLCMNGRALNEKAIEISPSSGRVLDRAADILVPFPPSKNRPRPGDWTCPSCGFSNFQRRTACFRCSYSAMNHHHGPEQMSYGYGYGGPPHMMGGPPHGYGGHMHGGHGHGGGRHGGQGIPFRPGDWKCGAEGCSYHNFAKNVSCLRCGASRATAQAPPEQNFQPGNPGMTMGNAGSHDMYQASMAGTPGPAPYGPPPTYGPGGGYQGHQYGGPASSYALPSGMGGGPQYPAMSSQYQQPNSGPHTSTTSFDNRASEAFSSAGATPSNTSYGGYQENQDPFHFLSSGIGGLSVNDSEPSRRNGGNPNSSKSPTTNAH